MTINHHPDYSTLMSYAAGSLPEPLSAVVAAHIEQCPECAREVKAMELIGAAMFERLDPAPIKACGTDASQTGSFEPIASVVRDSELSEHETTLSAIIGGELQEIQWKRLGFGIWHYPIKLSPGCKGDLRLLKVAPGQVMPEHGHGGSELTLILAGSYSDEFGKYRVGDVSDLGDDIEHRPVTDPDQGCICLIASDRKARFKDVLSRIIQPLTGL